MYTAETLKKYRSKLENAIAFYAKFPVESLTLCISNGNMKVGSTPNVSLPPILTCRNCKHCVHDCYDIKACMQYQNVTNARARNYVILKQNYNLFWKQLRAKLSKMRTKYFRFHVGGDIISEQYLIDMIKTAKMFLHIRFWTYTKVHDTVNEYTRKHGGSMKKACGENFVIMFSSWEGNPIDNPFGYPVFHVFGNGQKAPEGMFRCPSDYTWCINNKRGCPYGESACIEKH